MIYTIADTHLSFSSGKPMDIFGKKWENHAEKIKKGFRKIKDNDTVIIPGDISWAMNLAQAYEDLKFLNDLPGEKIIGKGNHDFWWATMKKLNAFREENKLYRIKFLYNNAYVVENKIICGTRGWMTDDGKKQESDHIMKHEAQRLEMSISEGLKLKEDYPKNEIVVFLHYPPVFGKFINYDMIDILYKNKIKNVYYGHLHNMTEGMAETEYMGIKMHLVSADYINFCPICVNKGEKSGCFARIYKKALDFIHK